MTAEQYEALSHELAHSGWERVLFDGGQSHTMGWTIMSVWELESAKITLNHSEAYNVASYEIEANPAAIKWLKQNGWEQVLEA